MSLKYFFLVALTFLAQSLQATDVNPTGKFGYVTLKMPAGANRLFPSEFKASFVKVSKGAVSITAPDTATKVFEGDGCLQIQGPSNSQSVRLCGYKITEGKTLEIPISLLQLKADLKPMETDLAPYPTVEIRAQNSALEIQKELGEARFLLAKPFSLLLPSGKYELRFGEVAALTGESKSIEVADATEQIVDLTPKDLRAEIVVKAEAAKFGVPIRQYSKINEVFVLVRDIRTIPKETETWNPLSDHQYKFAQSTQIPSSSKVWEKRFKAYPFPSVGNYRHDVVINNLVVPLSLAASASQTIELSALNVNHIDGNLPGYFTVHQLESSGERLFKWREGQMRYLTSSDKPTVRQAEDVANHGYVPTGKTVYVPNGFQYKVRTYAFDEVGEYKAQSEHDVDLR
jgi:hypothetical protein